MCWRMRAAQIRPCSQWSKWCPSFNKTSKLNQVNRMTNQAPPSSSHQWQRRHRRTPKPVHQLAVVLEVRPSCNRWWRIRSQCHNNRLPQAQKLLTMWTHSNKIVQTIMIHSLPLQVPCLMTFSASRKLPRRRKNRNLRRQVLQIYLRVWVKLTSTTSKNNSWACSRTLPSRWKTWRMRTMMKMMKIWRRKRRKRRKLWWRIYSVPWVLILRKWVETIKQRQAWCQAWCRAWCRAWWEVKALGEEACHPHQMKRNSLLRCKASRRCLRVWACKWMMNQHLEQEIAAIILVEALDHLAHQMLPKNEH